MLTPIRGYAAIGRGAAARRAGSGFALPEAERGQEAAAAGPVIGSLGLVGLQQGFSDAERDDVAQRRGRAVLEELEGLQLALLSGRADSGRLARLAQLAEGESGADPVLRGILGAISLRARIELARLPAASDGSGNGVADQDCPISRQTRPNACGQMHEIASGPCTWGEKPSWRPEDT